MLKSLSVVLSAAFLVFSAASAAELIPVKSGEKLAFLGDSITQFGNRPDGYVRLVVDGLFTAKIKVRPIPAGVSGNKSNDMLKRFSHVLSMKPDWLLLSCGVNDVGHGKRGVELPEFKSNITKIVDEADKAGVKVLIMTPTLCSEKDLKSPNNHKLEEYCDFLRALAKARGYRLADCNAKMRDVIQAHSEQPGFTVTIDNLHMNGYGNQMMAEAVLEAFNVPRNVIASARLRWNHIPSMAPVLNNAYEPAWLINMDTYLKVQREAERRKLKNPGDLFGVKVKEYIKSLKK